MSSNDKTNEVAIKVEHIGKTFQPQSSSQTIKEGFVGLGRKLSGKKSHLHHKGEYTALKDISFEIQKGEFLGIVGRNGSGKSTLLKIIAGVYTPTKGKVQVNGKLTPFIELGVGFNPELSGRDNVFLNGALLGFSRKEVEEIYDEIVDFAEIRDFMDTKLKNYSSGMQVRLAFSIAIKAQGDILVMDEVLAVGDEAFQRKCNEYFRSIKKDKSKTIILVSHNMEAVRRLCDKAILINKGEVVLEGSPEDVANEYGLENLESTPRSLQSNTNESEKKPSLIKNFKANLISPRLINQKDSIIIKVSYQVAGDIDTYVVADIRDLDRGAPLITAGSKKTNERIVTKTWKVKLETVNNTNLIVNLVVRDKNNDTLYFLPEEQCPKFAIRRNDYPNPKKPMTYAILFEKGEWK